VLLRDIDNASLKLFSSQSAEEAWHPKVRITSIPGGETVDNPLYVRYTAQSASPAQQQLQLALDAQRSAQKGVESAQRGLESAPRGLESAQDDLKHVKKTGHEAKVKEAEAKVKEAKQEVKEAEAKVKEAAKQVEKAEARGIGSACEPIKMAFGRVWVKVNDGDAVGYDVEGSCDVSKLLVEVHTREKLTVGVGKLKLYTSENKREKALS